MDYLKLFTISDVKKHLKTRPNESKFGEQIFLLPNSSYIYEQLLNLDVDYVIFGIKEDVGVFANLGSQGTSNAWDATIKILLNIQDNRFTSPKKVLILGSLEFESFQEKIKSLDVTKKKDLKKARKKVSKIDEAVTHLISEIVRAGKIPIVIGGGHNNAYGNIKGTALALKKPINAINFDAHTDFRAEEGRHSGNGFSYAFAEGFLKNYFVFGLHENYTSEVVFKTINKLKAIQYNTYEDIMIKKLLDFDTEMELALEHVSSKPFGIEIDCDAIENIPSSAISPSGFDVASSRRFVHFFGKQPKAAYLHICEAAPTPETETQVGKLITYLITDFIKANGN